MSAQDLLDLLRTRPFVPFRIHATAGGTHDIRHPDQALVLRTCVILPLSTTEEVSERSQHLALIHVIRCEELSSPTGATNGE